MPEFKKIHETKTKIVCTNAFGFRNHGRWPENFDGPEWDEYMLRVGNVINNEILCRVNMATLENGEGNYHITIIVEKEIPDLRVATLTSAQWLQQKLKKEIK